MSGRSPGRSTRSWSGALLLLVTAALAAACTESVEPERETIDIFGPYRERSAELFRDSLDGFAEQHGVEIRYTGTADFVVDLRRRVSNANPPDIAMVPQLGLIRELWSNDRILPLASDVVEAVEANYGEASLDLGRIDGTLVGVLYRASVKSLVWYRPSVFEAGGYEVPSTLEELERLAARMQSDGLAPWCFSIQARGATGWVATDWVEDLLVRQSGPDVYQRWVDGDVTFADPEVRAAFDRLAELVLARGRVVGGLERVLRATTTETHDPLFTSPPGCAMHRQASWVLAWAPEPFAIDEPGGDLAVFVLPGATSERAAPLLIGGDHAVAFTDRPIVHELMAHLASPESAEEWAASDAYFAPRTGAALQRSDDPLADLQAELIGTAEVLVFDGSDQMEPDFGSDVFWAEITRWVSGDISYDELARLLDAVRSE